jgi:microcystin-dependent protein
MSDPFIGEIRPWAGNFAPVGWMFCQGQILPISENETLFQLIGTTYGGDGQQTFALPDLRGRVPIHQGTGYALGQVGGLEAVPLTANELPAHTHTAQAQSAGGTVSSPAGAFWATSDLDAFSNVAPDLQLNPNALALTGGGSAHNNMMPFLTLNFIIALFGIFPPPN